jgi:uncharacterized membrane protein
MAQMSSEQDIREQDAPAPGWVDHPAPGTTTAGATAAVVPGQRTEAAPTAAPPAGEAPPPQEQSPPEPGAVEPGAVEPAAAEPGAAAHPTAPVGARPRPRLPRRDPLMRMGPWAPVAGAAVGLLLGVEVVLFLAREADTFDQRLALVFVVLGLTLLGAGGTLLADEVRLLRRSAQAAEARASGAGVIVGLLNGLTPARLLIAASAFVLLLSAYVTKGS